MAYKISLNPILGAGAALALAACAATPDAPAATAVAAQKVAPEDAVVYEAPVNDTERAILAANDLSATKKTSVSEDGRIRCKREPVVGSNFKRKICMRQDQWDAMAAESQKTTGDIQRRKAPGVTN